MSLLQSPSAIEDEETCAILAQQSSYLFGTCSVSFHIGWIFFFFCNIVKLSYPHASIFLWLEQLCLPLGILDEPMLQWDLWRWRILERGTWSCYRLEGVKGEICCWHRHNLASWLPSGSSVLVTICKQLWNIFPESWTLGLKPCFQCLSSLLFLSLNRRAFLSLHKAWPLGSA